LLIIYYLLNLSIKIYKIAIISNLPSIISKDNIDFDISSRFIVVIPTDKPVFEIAEDDSNNASIKFRLARKPMTNAETMDTEKNRKITSNASLNGLFVIAIDGGFK
jgi:hypothetical protein